MMNNLTTNQLLYLLLVHAGTTEYEQLAALIKTARPEAYTCIYQEIVLLVYYGYLDSREVKFKINLSITDKGRKAIQGTALIQERGRVSVGTVQRV